MINLLRRYEVPVGYSGHETGITVSLVAASMGAEIIEKHITLNRRQKGPDHKVSLEPYELKRLIRDIRVADQALGKQKRFLLRGEVLNRELFGKSLIASRTIQKGEVISESCVRVKGPGKGVAPYRYHELIGKKAERLIRQDCFFQDEDIDGHISYDFDQKLSGKWGFIARFSDYQEFLKYKPKVIEFHLAENDFLIPFQPDNDLNCQLAVHTPEYLGDHLFDLCSANESLRKDSVESVLKTMRLTSEIGGFFTGIPKVIIHPGAMSMQNKLDKVRLEQNLRRSVDEIKAESRDRNIMVLLENMPPYPWYFGGQWKGNYFMSHEDIIRFCNDTDMRICFDLSHAAMYCTAKSIDLKSMILELLPLIKHLHLADGYGLDGEGVQLGEGDIDLPNILPLFKNYKETWVPEIWRGHLNDGKGFLSALAYLKQYDL